MFHTEQLRFAFVFYCVVLETLSPDSLYLDCRESWVQVPPRAAPSSLNKGIIELFGFHLLCSHASVRFMHQDKLIYTLMCLCHVYCCLLKIILQCPQGHIGEFATSFEGKPTTFWEYYNSGESDLLPYQKPSNVLAAPSCLPCIWVQLWEYSASYMQILLSLLE